MRIAKKYMDMGNIADILSLKGTPRSAVDFKTLLKVSKLNEKEVRRALEELKESVAVTNTTPEKYYWRKKQRASK